jgi:hypothetical protein
MMQAVGAEISHTYDLVGNEFEPIMPRKLMSLLSRSELLLAASLAAGLLAAPDVAAQAMPDIATDRPSFSATPQTVGAGIWLGEFGYLYTGNDDGPDQQTLPQALLRYGLADDMELQINWSGYSRADSGGPSGFTDASIGVKIQLSDRPGATRMAFLATLSVPIGEDELSSDSFDPAVKFAWSHSGIADFFGTAAIASSDGDLTFSNGVGVAFAVGDRQGLFVEHQMDTPENSSTSHILNSGFTWLLSADTQVDLNASIGLNDNASDYTLGFGYARRFR